MGDGESLTDIWSASVVGDQAIGPIGEFLVENYADIAMATTSAWTTLSILQNYPGTSLRACERRSDALSKPGLHRTALR
jgi:hypothetical protein